MSTKDPKIRLAGDIEHLRGELASIELVTDHATPEEMAQIRRDQQELRETLNSKRALLGQLRLAEVAQLWAEIEQQLQDENILPIITPETIVARRLAEIEARDAAKGGQAA
ncbi:hypothetical protein HER32_06795 [Hymenobacter sp. BT18]|uniref:hypothetical protein n=1 Tax=Hymenobacter sp. BT18 TaxID=2835648 RepID=UPI00143EBC61|nr:hypothetical protein [Hymenobacter sp. BT18]QIX60901.1 hypothetical protein HER32_06795 [Hymenobacter sp. BT18]